MGDGQVRSNRRRPLPVIGVRFLTLSLGRLWFEIGALRSARAVFVAHCRIDNRLHLSFEFGRAERLRERVGEHRRRRAAAHVDGSVTDEEKCRDLFSQTPTQSKPMEDDPAVFTQHTE